VFEIRVEDNFSSAHRLREYKGKCEALHGHNWKVEIFIESENLDKIGIVTDFKKIKKLLSQVLEKLDHAFLNDITYFKNVNPTSENIAKYIFVKLQEKDKKLNLKKVTVWESDNSAASFIK
jgi:6-pyruvoyltetrahydropterin/6-carboxytetrahydropterin synthase